MTYDNDETDEPEDEDTDDEAEALLHRIETAFRSERTRIRGCEELQDLRGLRAEYQALAANARINHAARLRASDLVELVDDRITDVKAKRLADRSR